MINPALGVCAPKGFMAGAVHAGIKEGSEKDDVALILSDTLCSAAAVYTTNIVKADCLQVTKEHLADGKARLIVCNSGNANAAAASGYVNALREAAAAASAFHVSQDDVIVASTGVIGQTLPVEKIEDALPHLVLSRQGSEAAARAIMTTDTRLKSAVETIVLDGKTVTLGGIAKGSGMIHPNMGTMLCFITTDAAIAPELLEKALQKCVKKTFNRISVDGDTSTNDMCAVLANGLAENAEIVQENEDWTVFCEGLQTIMQTLAIAIASDGEGASRLLTVSVQGASSEEQAEILARSVASSSLLKAAMFGRDANWGRVICAMGYSGASFDPQKADISFASQQGEISVCQAGREVKFDEEKALDILSQDSVEIRIDIHEGQETATCWGCDLTYEYVRINGEYRS